MAKPPASIGAGDPSPGGGTETPAADVPVSFAVDGRLKIVGLGFTFEAFPIVHGGWWMSCLSPVLIQWIGQELHLLSKLSVCYC